MLKKLLENFFTLDVKKLRYRGFVKENRSQIQEGYDNVKNGHGWRNKNKECPLCGDKNKDYLFERFRISYLRCSNCTCAYVEKFPKDFSDIYNDKNYKNIAEKAYISNVDYRVERFAPERISLIKRFIPKVKNPKLLDIGCGTGWFLEYAKHAGFNVSGIEFSKNLALATSSRLGVPIYTDLLNTLPKPKVYDVITMFDVIEHIPDPGETIKIASKYLSKGGILLMYTPNLESLAIHYLKEHSSSVIPVHHPFLFTKKSIEMLIVKHGLKVIYYATKGSDIVDMYAHHDQLEVNKDYAKFLHKNIDLLQAIVDKAECGSHLRIIAQKK